MPKALSKETAIVFGLLLGIFAWRAQGIDQPVIENYVGRQIPTAMVVRNLTRGSGFLSPQLDTGPFPNRFVVEAPVYAQSVAWISSITRLPIDATGRVVSAASTALAAWGLFGLVRRRSDLSTAVATVIAFATFPVTIRYGRAFQPDAFAMGLVVAGLRFWDDGRPIRMTIGWACLALGLAQKASWAFALAPLLLAVLDGKPRPFKLIALTTLLAPLCWYLHAGLSAISGTDGSAASSDNVAQWAARLAPTAFLQPGRYGMVARDLFYRACTPLGFGLAALGLAGWATAPRLWKVWLPASSATMILLFGKLHHDYYWMMMAPPLAAWAGLGVARIKKRSTLVATLCLLGLVAMGWLQTRATWKTPDEWRDAVALADSIRCRTGRDDLVIAPEAVLYLGDRRGCRLEYDTLGAKRAANEWRPAPPYAEDDPAALVDFYRWQAKARFFADLTPRPGDLGRQRLHARVRSDPDALILDDSPGRYLLVEFRDQSPRIEP